MLDGEAVVWLNVGIVDGAGDDDKFDRMDALLIAPTPADDSQAVCVRR